MGHNLSLIAHVDAIGARCGTPVLIGLSRKSFLGRIMGDMERDRTVPTIAANVEAARRGAFMLRVHDVGVHRDAFAAVAAVGGGAMSDSEREVEIAIDGLAVFAHHGALPEEQALGQRFFLDIRMIPLRDARLRHGRAGRRDRLRRRRTARARRRLGWPVPPAGAPGRRGRGHRSSPSSRWTR